MANEVTIQLTTTCGVETCRDCKFLESRINMADAVPDITRWCGAYHQRLAPRYGIFAEFYERCAACIAEHGKGPQHE